MGVLHNRCSCDGGRAARFLRVANLGAYAAMIENYGWWSRAPRYTIISSSDSVAPVVFHCPISWIDNCSVHAWLVLVTVTVARKL